MHPLIHSFTQLTHILVIYLLNKQWLSSNNKFFTIRETWIELTTT